MKIRLLALTFAAGILGTPPQGAYFSREGNQISYVPLIQGVGRGVGNAPTDDHQRATALLASRTSDDGHSQENTLGVETAVVTGMNHPWRAYANFIANSNIFVPRNALPNGVYRQVAGRPCLSGEKPPSGFGDAEQRQNDGSCIWKWINLPNVGGKVGIYSEETVSPGAGNTWNLALNTLLQPNTPLSFHANAEFDFGNNAADCFGASNCINLEVKTGGAYRSTHGLLVDTANAGETFATHFGLRLAGEKLDSDADIETDASGAVGLGICSTGFVKCRHSDAAIDDRSDSANGLKLAGVYSAFSILAPGFRVDPVGSVASDGVVKGKRFSADLYTPPKGNTPCSVGEFSDDNNYHYVCVGVNQWKRAALSSF